MAYIYDLDPITSLNEADVFILNTSNHVGQGTYTHKYANS